MRPNELMVTALTRMLSTAKLGLFLEHYSYKPIVACEKNENCVRKSMTGLVEVFACQLLLEQFDLKDGESLIEVAGV